MFCGYCQRDKHPGLFPASERKKPATWKHKCMKCAHEMRDLVRNPQRKGAAWLVSNRTMFVSVMKAEP